MIHEYPPENRIMLIRLFDDHRYLHDVSEALLKDGIGEVYVNHRDTPTVVLLIRESFIFLAGDEKDASVPLLLDKIPQKCTIFVPNDRWAEKLKVHWGTKLKQYPRTKFASDALDIGQMKMIQNNLPDGLVIERLTVDMIHQISEQAKGIIRIFYPSLEKFMESNFGFYIRDGNTIASLALAATPLYNNEFEIQIETDPEYRRKGLAMIVCAKLIQYSLENGLTPLWDADNDLSVYLAKKLGFTNPEQYDVYYWRDE